MPGPKMGPRPADFDEELVRQSPTYAKWTGLVDGQKLRYACREFVKGQGDDEERLLRRIMIARRNNIRDHEMLKRARSRHTPTTTTNMSTAMSTTTTMSTTAGPVVVPVGLADAVQAAVDEAAAAAKPAAAVPMRTRRPPHSFSDHQVEKEMDVASVEKTRSYRTWVELAHGSEFVYNQKYIKGREGHDWLLRKNIWRRMRYRRENKQMVERMKTVAPGDSTEDGKHQHHQQQLPTVEDIKMHVALVNTMQEEEQQQLDAGNADAATHAAAAAAACKSSELHLADQAAVEAAVAAAESFGKAAVLEEETEVAAAAALAAQEAAAAAAAAAVASGVVDDDNNNNNEGITVVAVHNPLENAAVAVAETALEEAAEIIEDGESAEV